MIKRLRSYSLRKQFIFLIFLILLILLSSFVITNIIATNMIEKKSIETSEKLVLQVEDKINTFYSDMLRISTSLIYSPTINDFLSNEDRLNRTLTYKDVLSVFSNTISLKEDIKGINLYDKELVNVARTGGYINKNELPIESVVKLTYTGILNQTSSNTQETYAIIAPIYDLNRISSHSKTGICVFVMDTKNFSQLLKNALITENSKMILMDKNNNIIAKIGNNLNYFDISQAEHNNEFLVQKFTLAETGWQLISIIPKNELFSETNMVQKFNLIAYITIFGILIVFVLMFIIGILNPVNKLIYFMQTYTKMDKRSRVKDVSNNEVGRIAITLNQMLDDINRLSHEVQQFHKQIYEMEIVKKQMEITSYRNQINPHFLYNTFECIRGMALYYHAKEIVGITESLSRIYRYAVKGNNFVTVEEEVEHIREYANIIECRFMGKIRVEINMDEEIATEKIIKLILQPIVENAVFHGLEKRLEQGCVIIHIYKTKENKIMFVIKDNGIGMDEYQLNKLNSKINDDDFWKELRNASSGVGLVNIHNRLKLFYKGQAEFNIKSEFNIGTTVIMAIPILDENMEV